MMYIIYLPEKIARGVQKIAKRILNDYVYIPCYAFYEGKSEPLQVILFRFEDNDDRIRFIEFYEECLANGYDFEFDEISAQAPILS